MKICCCRSHQLVLAAVLMIASVSTGCRAPTWKMPTWKMPGSSLFAKREPDASTLAGKNGTTLPEGPAAKYTAETLAGSTPSGTLAKTVSNPTRSDSAGRANGFPGSGASTAYGAQAGIYGTGTSGIAGSGMGGAGAGGYGSTAGSPYSMAPTTPPGGYGSRSTTPPANAANSGLNNSSPSMPSPSMPSPSMPSPYGGGYASSTGAVAGSLPNPSATIGGAGVNYPPLPNAANNSPVYPSGYTSTGSNPGSAATGYGSVPTGPSMPPLPTGPSIPQVQTSAPNLTTPPVSPTNSSLPPTAYQGATLQGYAPGSTGRGTTYDFSGGAGSTIPSTTTPSRPTYTLPPNTAAGQSNAVYR